MYESRLEDLPEAVPLQRTSSAWRLVAILALIMAGGLFLAVLVLGVVVARLESELDDYQAGTYGSSPLSTWSPAGTTPLQDEPVPDDGPNAVNLPYPVKEDLKAVAERPVGDPQERPRARFLKLSQEVWKSPRNQGVVHVLVSPDGQNFAYFNGVNLVAGPFNNPQVVEVLSGGAGEKAPVRDGVNREQQLVGMPAWSSDSRSVYFSTAGCRMYRYDCENNRLETLSFRGQLPVPMPGDPERVVFVRFRSAPKSDAPGSRAVNDPSEIVVGNTSTKDVRVIVASQAARWGQLAVSPGGGQLAVLRQDDPDVPGRFASRINLVQMAGGELTPIGPTTDMAGPLAWTPDGTALVYTRHQYPLPPESWPDSDDEYPSGSDLFQWHLAAERETRLSRGADFASPSVSSNGNLFFTSRAIGAADGGRVGARVYLYRTSLAGARQFVAAQPEAPVRDAAAWKGLVDQVLSEAKLAAVADGGQITGDDLARLADAFQRLYRERFKEEPPDSLARFTRLQRELAPVQWNKAEQARADLVFGAVQGEYLRTKHGARWHLAKGPLVKSGQPAVNLDTESPFGFVVNPFARLVPARADSDDDDGGVRWMLLENLVRQAEGRPLVLSNDLDAGQASLTKEADPDLDRGEELLEDDKGAEGEQLLLKMLARKTHRGNLYLTLQVCDLLYEHDRLVALRKLLEPRCLKPPYDARQFNFLGLAQLDNDPRQALNAFKKALRCDLRYGPGYLNLALAYEKAGETANARAVLKRYLDVVPYGPHAEDALRRLVGLEAQE